MRHSQNVRLSILGSGSKGNALVVDHGETRLVVDAGVPLPELLRRAELHQVNLEKVNAIVTTHAHCDHARHAARYAEHFSAPLYLTESTQRGLKLPRSTALRVFGPKASFWIGDIEVRPLAVPHDCPQVALVFSADGCTAGLVTDTGTVSRALLEHLESCATLLLESNYEPSLLALGPYPPKIQRRVASERGHLSNAQAGEALRKLRDGLRQVALVHISQTNNESTLALGAARVALEGTRVELHAAETDGGLVLDVPAQATQLPLLRV